MSADKLAAPLRAETSSSDGPSWMASAEEFFLERRGLAIGILAAILLIPIGIGLYMRAQGASEREAQATLARADRELLSGNAAPAATFYQDVVDRFGSTRSAGWAQLGLGHVAMAQGRPADALKAFAAASESRDASLSVAGRRGHAAALEDTGKPAEAGAEYEKLAATETGEDAIDDLISAARAYKTANNAAKAREILTKVLADTPTTPRATEIQTLLGESQ